MIRTMRGCAPSFPVGYKDEVIGILVVTVLTFPVFGLRLLQILKKPPERICIKFPLQNLPRCHYITSPQKTRKSKRGTGLPVYFRGWHHHPDCLRCIMKCHGSEDAVDCNSAASQLCWVQAVPSLRKRWKGIQIWHI